MSKENDFIDIGTSGKGRGSRNIFQQFRQKLVEKEQEYVRQYKPYWANAAKKDWEDKVKTRLANYNLREDQVTEEQLKLNIDLDYYGDSKNFDLIKTERDEEDVRIGLSVQKVLRGYKEIYVFKPTGNEVTVFIPLSEWEKRKGNKSSKTPESELKQEEPKEEVSEIETKT